MRINQVTDIFIAFPNRQLYPKPVGLLGTNGCGAGTGGGSNFRHAAKIRIGKEIGEKGLWQGYTSLSFTKNDGHIPLKKELTFLLIEQNGDLGTIGFETHPNLEG